MVESGERRGETLGALWAARCCEIGSCAAEIDTEIESGTFPPALPADVPQLPPPPPSSPPGSLEAGESDEVSYWLMIPNPNPNPGPSPSPSPSASSNPNPITLTRWATG